MALTDNLVSWYNLEDATDQHASNNLSDIGTPTYTTGKVNNALTLDGSTDGLKRAAFFNPGTSDFTVAFWAKIANASTWRFCLGQTLTDGTDEWEFRAQQTTGVMNFHYEDSLTAGSISIFGATNICDNAWHFIVGLRSGTAVQLYVDDMTTTDGSATDSTPYTISNSKEFTMGAAGFSAPYIFWLSGQMDSVGLWTRALSQAERETLYNSGSGVAYSDLTGGGGGGGPTIFVPQQGRRGRW